MIITRPNSGYSSRTFGCTFLQLLALKTDFNSSGGGKAKLSMQISLQINLYWSFRQVSHTALKGIHINFLQMNTFKCRILWLQSALAKFWKPCLMWLILWSEWFRWPCNTVSASNQPLTTNQLQHQVISGNCFSLNEIASKDKQVCLGP